MSFWDLSDNTSAVDDVKKEYEVPGGNMDPIPNNSDCLAEITAAKWATKGEGSDQVRYVELRWDVEKPDAYAKRVVFHKLWVDDLDPSANSEDKAKTKRDKARRMLATIDANAGGKLAKSNDAPTDDGLALALVGTKAVIKVMVWEMADSRDPGNTMRGNWISAVKDKTSPTSEGEPMKPKANGAGAGGQPSNGGGWDDLGDNIPFFMEWRA